MKIQKSYTAREVKKIAALVSEQVMPGTVVTLIGPLGAGKTTLVKALLAQWGVQGEVTSPTFGYVVTYETSQGPVHHFDLYRVDSVDAFCELGFEEYLSDPRARVCIEWPEVIAELLERHSHVVAVHLSYDVDSHDRRHVMVQGYLMKNIRQVF